MITLPSVRLVTAPSPLRLRKHLEGVWKAKKLCFFFVLLFGSNKYLTGVKDRSVDPALSVADRHLAVGVAEQDVCATGPGSRRHSVGVVAAPVPHQHALVITRVQLSKEQILDIYGRIHLTTTIFQTKCFLF